MSNDAFKTWLEVLRSGVRYPMNQAIKESPIGTRLQSTPTRKQNPSEWYSYDSSHEPYAPPRNRPFNGNSNLREEPRQPWPSQFSSPTQPNEYGEYDQRFRDTKTDRPFYTDYNYSGGGK